MDFATEIPASKQIAPTTTMISTPILFEFASVLLSANFPSGVLEPLGLLFVRQPWFRLCLFWRACFCQHRLSPRLIRQRKYPLQNRAKTYEHYQQLKKIC
jgi:hypothetical protein